MNGIIGSKKLFNSTDKSGNAFSNHQFFLQQDKDKKIFTHTVGQFIFGNYQDKNTETKNIKEKVFIDADKKFALAFDGTIFNYQTLKNNLLKQNVFFQTNTDTEVLFHHLIAYREEGISNLRGSFAFAFYDFEKEELLLARDHFGIMPLLYTVQENEIFFASELTVFKNLAQNWEINNQALDALFRFTYIPAPETILKGIKKLLPGQYLKVKNNKVELVQYYSVRAQKTTTSFSENPAKEVEERLKNAVLERMETPLPLGSFLSGGIDSSIVSQIASTFKEKIDTFSIGFKENGFFDESGYAQNVAQHIKSNHHLIQLTKTEIVSSFQDVLSAFDEPYADSSVVALYFLIQEAQKTVSLCLSGDAADEIFGGYNKHKAFLRSKNPGLFLKTASKFAAMLPGGNRRGKFSNRVRQLKKFRVLLQQKWPETYWSLAQFISKNRRQSILIQFEEYQPTILPGENKLRDFLWTDQEFVLPNDMLKKIDIMGRHFNFEIRSPFLDVDLVDFANQLPDELRINGNQGKKILKGAFHDKLPEEVFVRSKRGFEIPLQEWIISGWEKIVSEKWFDKEFLEKQNLFSFAGIEKLKQDFFEAKEEEEATTTMWAYITFQNWFERWKRK